MILDIPRPVWRLYLLVGCFGYLTPSTVRTIRRSSLDTSLLQRTTNGHHIYGLAMAAWIPRPFLCGYGLRRRRRFCRTLLFLCPPLAPGYLFGGRLQIDLALTGTLTAFLVVGVLGYLASHITHAVTFSSAENECYLHTSIPRAVRRYTTGLYTEHT